MITADSTA